MDRMSSSDGNEQDKLFSFDEKARVMHITRPHRHHPAQVLFSPVLHSTQHFEDGRQLPVCMGYLSLSPPAQGSIVVCIRGENIYPGAQPAWLETESKQRWGGGLAGRLSLAKQTIWGAYKDG